MYYVVLCQDKTDSQNLRLETRPRHLNYLKSLAAKLKFAGPFVDGQGQPTGTMLVVEAESEAEAQKIAENDPYAQAGLFSSWEIKCWNWTINNPKVSS